MRFAPGCAGPTPRCSWSQPADEIDEATRLLWRECAVIGMPRAVAVTKLEQARADFDETVARCQRAFGDAQPVDIPLLSAA